MEKKIRFESFEVETLPIAIIPFAILSFSIIELVTCMLYPFTRKHTYTREWENSIVVFPPYLCGVRENSPSKTGTEQRGKKRKGLRGREEEREREVMCVLCGRDNHPWRGTRWALLRCCGLELSIVVVSVCIYICTCRYRRNIGFYRWFMVVKMVCILICCWIVVWGTMDGFNEASLINYVYSEYWTIDYFLYEFWRNYYFFF